MQKYRKILGILGISLIMLNTGCSNVALTKDQKVEQAFEKHLSIYPVKSLEDFYDMEGYRDKNFDKDDKGTWIVNASIASQADDRAPLFSKRIVLYLNKNTKQGKGNVYFNTYTNDIKKDKREKFDVELVNGQIVLTGKHTKEVEAFVKDFRFLVQDQKISNLSEFEKIDSRHNSNAPLYSIDYKLPENHSVSQWLKKHYNVELGNTVLTLKQTGELKGDSTGAFNIEIRKKKDNGALNLFRESVNYSPSY
ncbi:tandem-type lipoprotein [Macrococcoides canis]|uniref:tandem-type lipoprotein n=1 Tax=Macrococcoides canis TaxID=1855823 RepID=UPI0020B86C57|nr:tandem-type lipoprotein [Macrococcus canis]UTH01895.1 tandem-type lipoprotein [Macrococcus canis]